MCMSRCYCNWNGELLLLLRLLLFLSPLLAILVMKMLLLLLPPLYQAVFILYSFSIFIILHFLIYLIAKMHSHMLKGNSAVVMRTHNISHRCLVPWDAMCRSGSNSKSSFLQTAAFLANSMAISIWVMTMMVAACIIVRCIRFIFI